MVVTQPQSTRVEEPTLLCNQVVRRAGGFVQTGFWGITCNIESFLRTACHLPAIKLATLRLTTECSYGIQFAEKKEVGSPG